MCDYSLHTARHRPANLGDELVTTRFIGTATKGFCSVDELDVAVCLKPGTEIAFEDDVKSRDAVPGFLFWRTRKHPRVAVFTKIQHETNDHYKHHDALEFPDGTRVLLTNLVPRQRARVLQLPVESLSGEQRAQIVEAVEREIAEPVA